jgi:hypothetical protein
MATFEGLETIDEARRALKVSRSYLYRLSADTPGVYVLGRAKRFCVEELRAWARRQAEGKCGGRTIEGHS